MGGFKFTIPDGYHNNYRYGANILGVPTLEEMCIKIVDAFPMPICWCWTTEEVAEWIRDVVGFPEYSEAFTLNMINGRTLILVDASVLVEMNIRNFEDIKIITKAIREIMGVEPEEAQRSISLPPRYPDTMYKLCRVRTGPIMDNTTRSELWRKMKILRDLPTDVGCEIECNKYKSPFPYELFGYNPRRHQMLYNLYRAPKKPKCVQQQEADDARDISVHWSRPARRYADTYDYQFDLITKVVNRPRQFHILTGPEE